MIEMNPIEEHIIENDIPVMIEKATDFGKDIADSFVRLAEKLNTPGEKRECYGIVSKDSRGMNYHAAFTELHKDEAAKKKIETFIIPKGLYYSIRVDDWNKNILHIGPTFDQILKSGKVDSNSPCVEYYKTEKELICMVMAK